MLIQELMGYTTIEMTMRYAHLATEISGDAVEKLDQAEKFLGYSWAQEQVA